MMTKPLDRLLDDSDKAFTMLRGSRITKKEYELVCERMEELKKQVLLPCSITDESWRKTDET